MSTPVWAESREKWATPRAFVGEVWAGWEISRWDVTCAGVRTVGTAISGTVSCVYGPRGASRGVFISSCTYSPRVTTCSFGCALSRYQRGDPGGTCRLVRTFTPKRINFRRTRHVKGRLTSGLLRKGCSCVIAARVSGKRIRGRVGFYITSGVRRGGCRSYGRSCCRVQGLDSRLYGRRGLSIVVPNTRHNEGCGR